MLKPIPTIGRHIRVEEIWLQSFLTLTLDGNEWPISCTDHFSPSKGRRYPSYGRLGGLESLSGCFGKKIKSFVPSRYGTRIVQPVAFTVSANRYSFSKVFRDQV